MAPKNKIANFDEMFYASTNWSASLFMHASSSNNTIQNKTTPNTTTTCIQGFMDLNLGGQSIDATCITTNAKPINLGDSNL
jgi:hypothetical protein